MANTVVDETVKAVEEATEIAVEPVKETVKALPKKGKTALIIGGSAGAVVVVYIGYKKLVEPKLGKKSGKKTHVNVEEPKEEAIPVEAEPVTEAEVKKNGKKK